MKYQVWLKDRKEETIKEIDVPLKTFNGLKEKSPSPMRVKNSCCPDIFPWTEYTNIKIKKL